SGGKGAVKILVRGLLDAGPLIVEHEDGIVDEFVSLGFARYDFMKRAVHVLDHEVHWICRQIRGAEQNIEHAIVGMNRGRVIELTLVAPPERGAEREQGVSR